MATIKIGSTDLNKGIKGDTGNNGVNGLSAYEVAVAEGFVGTEAEWITSLQGADGVVGIDGAGYGYSITFMSNKVSDTQPIALQQYAYYDELTDEIVFSWANTGILVKTDNKIHFGNLYLSTTNDEIRLSEGEHAYVLETDLAETGNFNVPVYYDSNLFSGNLGTEGRVVLAIRDTTNANVITPSLCDGIFANYMNGIKNSYVDTDANDFYDLGSQAKDYTPPTASKYGIITWGDSILDGRVAIGETSTPTIPNAFIYHRNNDVFQTFELGVNDGGQTFTDTRWGWDLEVYHKLQTYLADDIYICKRALGGTDLRTYWDADIDNINTPGFEALTLELEEMIVNAEQKAISSGVNMDWRAMIISVGSNDNDYPDLEAFEMLLTRIVAYIRGVVNNPKLKVIVPTISPSSDDYKPSHISSLMRMAKKDPYFYYTVTPTMTMLDDGLVVHPDAAGCVVIGEQVYQKIKDYGQTEIRTVPKRAERAVNNTVINLSNCKGVYYVNSAASDTLYTLTNTHIIGGKATIWINLATQPNITTATYRTGYGNAFASSTNMYMQVENIGGTVKYWFETY